MGKILIVEDEISIQRILEFELKQWGLDVSLASNGEEGVQKGLADNYDVILLDVMLPVRDGFSVCKELREKGIDSHIVMLSARDEEFNRIMGLEVGADDYMTKPFSAREVASKIKAILRRKKKDQQPVLTPELPQTEEVQGGNYLTCKTLKLDTQKIEVWADSNRLDFTLKEYELLAFLMKNKNKALSRDILLDHLWGMEYFGETRVVDVHIFKIRDKLKPYDIKIKTVRGIGYMLEGEESA
ncbi:MAG: response regulator transcription factor [Turicibacter sp.]|nr:response regulator transcription factor [Turicibacter sp.]